MIQALRQKRTDSLSLFCGYWHVRYLPPRCLAR
jgi:hypothetical protein